MRAKIAVSDLLEPLQWTSRMVSPRATLPALTFIKLTAANGKLELLGSNLETWGRAYADAVVEADGAVLLPAKLLTTLVSKLPDGIALFDVDNGKVSISCGPSTFSLRCGPIDDFPDAHTPDDVTVEVDIRTDAFTRMVEQVCRAASTDDARPVLTGVHLSLTDDLTSVQAAATDSYRLAAKAVPLGAAPDQPIEGGIIIPATTLSEAVKAIGSSDLTVRLGMSPDRAVLSIGDRTLSSRLIEGSYPTWNKLIPDAANAVGFVVAERSLFSEVLNRVSVVAMGQSNTPVTLHFSPDASSMSLVAGNAEVGNANESMPATFEGMTDDASISFNPSFLAAALESLGTERVRLMFNGETKPALVLPDTDDEDYADDYRHLLMPMRVN